MIRSTSVAGSEFATDRLGGEETATDHAARVLSGVATQHQVCQHGLGSEQAKVLKRAGDAEPRDLVRPLDEKVLVWLAVGTERAPCAPGSGS